MKSGQLDQRVTLEQRVQGEDEAGQAFDSWVPVGSFWAAVEPLAGREYLAAQAVTSEVTTRVRMRYRPGITSAMRLIHGADSYGIVSVIDLRSQNRELQLMCTRVA